MSGEPKTLTPPWAYYRRKGLSEMRPYVPGEDLKGISVSTLDLFTLREAAEQGADPGGYIARNPDNHADQWYVNQEYFEATYEPVGVPVVARDEAPELRDQVEELTGAVRYLRKSLEDLLAPEVLRNVMNTYLRSDLEQADKAVNGARVSLAASDSLLRRLAGGESEK